MWQIRFKLCFKFGNPVKIWNIAQPPPAKKTQLWQEMYTFLLKNICKSAKQLVAVQRHRFLDSGTVVVKNFLPMPLCLQGQFLNKELELPAALWKPTDLIKPSHCGDFGQVRRLMQILAKWYHWDIMFSLGDPLIEVQNAILLLY